MTVQPALLQTAIGVLEVAGAVGLLLGSGLAWVALTVTMGLALWYHIGTGDASAALAVPAVLLVLLLLNRLTRGGSARRPAPKSGANKARKD